MKKVAVIAGMLVAISAGSAQASAAQSAGCTGQFFSQHAGIVPATGGEITVGSFISPTARELRADYGHAISGARTLPRDNCGL